MIEAKKALKTALLTASALILLVAGFNYLVDPYAKFARRISTNKTSLSFAYELAKQIIRSPDAEQIILGSSRGMSSPPKWFKKTTGMKTINLSAAGVEMIIKSAFLNLALEKCRIRRVVWYADYFEHVPSNSTNDIKNTPMLMRYSEGYSPGWDALPERASRLISLLDFKAVSESINYLTMSAKDISAETKAAPDIEPEECENPKNPITKSPQKIRDELDILFNFFLNSMAKLPQEAGSWNNFQSLMAKLKRLNIPATIIIAPYSPAFMSRLKNERPALFAAHLKWIAEVEKLASPGIEVKNYFNGIPDDDGSTRFWKDGTHFTCLGMSRMVKKTSLANDHNSQGSR